MEWNFPIYRKYPGDKTLFKISAIDEFEELSLMGSKIIYHHTKAKIHPDRLRILDMIEMKDNTWEICQKKQYDSRKEQFDIQD